jgi:glycine dehydrogenase subunit 1
MRYIPHTEEEIKTMLADAGISSIEELFKSIPSKAKLNRKMDLPPALSEPELIKHFKELGLKNMPAGDALSFLGAGSYHHHVPAAVSDIVGRSEWLTPYTPYQPEISQGTLQAIFEFQSMICSLTGMDVTNASHYDGATATAEAALMALQKTRRKNVVVASTLHPEYRDTMKTILTPRENGVNEIPFGEDGRINVVALKELLNSDAACLIVQSPNFFGILEDLEEIGKIVTEAGAMFVVTITDPTCLGILENPGAFGADIVTAEGQAFGCGLNYGGPYLGIFAAREKYLRTMPGRISGATVDQDGKRGFVLTMSTREQHIRRERATSNICSNEAHLALTAAVYLSLLGKQGLKRLAEINLANSTYLKSELSKLPGVSVVFDAPTYNEFVIKVEKDTDGLSKIMLGKDIFLGVPLDCWYPNLSNHLLLCTTECHTKSDLDKFVEELKKEL